MGGVKTERVELEADPPDGGGAPALGSSAGRSCERIEDRHRPERGRIAYDPPAAMLKDAAAIVGIAETAFAKKLDASEKSLACQAILGALDDAGIATA